jgi:hypothetical protein
MQACWTTLAAYLHGAGNICDLHALGAQLAHEVVAIQHLHMQASKLALADASLDGLFMFWQLADEAVPYGPPLRRVQQSSCPSYPAA